ncbi:unnamed protein product [Larinioides sclopetarius]|uniref:Uncharacterized protein n=1 Tax=Larinioides sclopetarius TaxID=280406 RepID=A0AAV2ARH7_9ARAC
MAEREHELSLPTLYFVSLVVSEDKWRKSREAKVAVMSSRNIMNLDELLGRWFLGRLVNQRNMSKFSIHFSLRT